MAADLRILHTADSHIGADLPRRAGGRCPRRGCDFVDSYRCVLALAHTRAVDLVIHAGDVFDEPQPAEGAIAAATQPLWDLAVAGIPVVIIPGNHERSTLPQVLLLSHANIHVLREPRTITIERAGLRVVIAGFPCLRRDARGQFATALERTGWQHAGGDINILAVHQTFAGARCGPANFQFRDGDDVIPPDALPPGLHYVAAGHIHRHQSLNGAAGSRPPIVYAGSPDRIAFAEIGEPKGCVVVEFTGGAARPRFVEHAVRPMEILPIDVSGLSGAEVIARVEGAVRGLPSAAVAQVRLSGQATRGALAGLQLTEHIRAARPDVLPSVSAQAIEWISQREAFRTASASSRSAFEVLDAPPGASSAVPIAEVGALPTTCGTYALYDDAGRLLYVGKAVNLRARVRSHLRDSTPGNQFRGWARQAARVEARPAGSELEALLVEAELIRRLAPPFNRQVRLWKRYCYLCDRGQPFGQLVIEGEPGGRFAFGPLRGRALAEAACEALSVYFGLARCPEDAGPALRALPAGSPAQLCERHFAGSCAGPCGGRIDDAAYRARLAAREALLSGVETDDVRRIRAESEAFAADTACDADPARRAGERVVRTMLELCRTAALLRAARAMLNALLILPGEGELCTLALVTMRGLHLASIARAEASDVHIAEWVRARVGRARPASGPALPKPVADCLCTAVLQSRRSARERSMP